MRARGGVVVMGLVWLWAAPLPGAAPTGPPAAAPAPDPAQGEAQAPDEAALRALLAEFLAGASRDDAAVHDRFWAESLVYTGASGRRIGKSELMKGVRSAPPAAAAEPPTRYSAEDVRVQLLGDTAVVAFRLVALTGKAEPQQRSEYLNTGTFVKRDGRWQALAWQATRAALTEEDARRQAAAAESAFHAALLAADVEALGSLLEPDCVWIHSDGRRLSGSQLVDQLRSGALRYSKLETSDVTLSVHGDTAVVRGSSSRQRSSIPESPGTADPAPRAIAYTLTLARDGAAWKVMAVHTSRLGGS